MFTRRLLFLPLAVAAIALGLAASAAARTSDANPVVAKVTAPTAMASSAGSRYLVAVVVRPSQLIAWVAVSRSTYENAYLSSSLQVVNAGERVYTLMEAFNAPHARAVVLDRAIAPGPMADYAGGRRYLVEVATGTVRNAVWVTVSRRVWENAYLGETYSAQRIARQLFTQVTSGSVWSAMHVIVILPQLQS